MHIEKYGTTFSNVVKELPHVSKIKLKYALSLVRVLDLKL